MSGMLVQQRPYDIRQLVRMDKLRNHMHEAEIRPCLFAVSISQSRKLARVMIAVHTLYDSKPHLGLFPDIAPAQYDLGAMNWAYISLVSDTRPKALSAKYAVNGTTHDMIYVDSVRILRKRSITHSSQSRR